MIERSRTAAHLLTHGFTPARSIKVYEQGTEILSMGTDRKMDATDGGGPGKYQAVRPALSPFAQQECQDLR